MLKNRLPCSEVRYGTEEVIGALELIRTFNIPAYTNGSARGIFRNNDPLSFDATRDKALPKPMLFSLLAHLSISGWVMASR